MQIFIYIYIYKLGFQLFPDIFHAHDSPSQSKNSLPVLTEIQFKVGKVLCQTIKYQAGAVQRVGLHSDH
jgi:hypothetical protein